LGGNTNPGTTFKSSTTFEQYRSVLFNQSGSFSRKQLLLAMASKRTYFKESFYTEGYTKLQLPGSKFYAINFEMAF
jgi:hypothetical protein